MAWQSLDQNWYKKLKPFESIKVMNRSKYQYFWLITATQIPCIYKLTALYTPPYFHSANYFITEFELIKFKFIEGRKISL
jgi:hypothetical protein